ncbi:hypothetical protein BJV77DRAFT_1150250 [Russula vinacea]|nr:hypothetical protein BJV77DRAFT_1150250 [Russula vinacea]
MEEALGELCATADDRDSPSATTTREQQLEAGGGYLVAEVDLDAARNHIQQLSRSSKQALASLNATHDEYESTTEAQLTASWANTKSYRALEERRTANRNSNKSTREEWQADMRTLGDAIVDMSAAEKNLAEDRISHLDNVSSQAARIRRALDSPVGTPGEGETVNGTEFKLSELCYVINYLRKEKEIVVMQLVLCERENARLRRDSDTSLVTWKTQGLLEYATSVAATDAQHAELVEKIQQLNLLRDSNATLRADSEAHAKRLIAQFTACGRPHHAGKLDARNEYVARLEDETHRRQERNSQLLTKAEKLAWETERATHSSNSTEQQEKIVALEKMNKAQKDAITKNDQIFRQRMSALGAQNTQLKTNLEAAQKESATILEERDAFKASAPTESASVPHTEELERLRREKAALTQERDQFLAKRRHGKSPRMPPEALFRKIGKLKKQSLSSHDAGKIAREEAEKLREAERGNAQYFDTRTAGCAIEEQDAAIKSAAEKATSELRTKEAELKTKHDAVIERPLRAAVWGHDEAQVEEYSIDQGSKQRKWKKAGLITSQTPTEPTSTSSPESPRSSPSFRSTPFRRGWKGNDCFPRGDQGVL